MHGRYNYVHAIIFLGGGCWRRAFVASKNESTLFPPVCAFTETNLFV